PRDGGARPRPRPRPAPRCTDPRPCLPSYPHVTQRVHDVYSFSRSPGPPARRAPLRLGAHRVDASASGRGTTPQAATTSLATSRNSVPVATVLVAPSSGLWSVTTTTTRGSSAGSMPATLSVYSPGT